MRKSEDFQIHNWPHLIESNYNPTLYRDYLHTNIITISSRGGKTDGPGGHGLRAMAKWARANEHGLNGCVPNGRMLYESL